MPYYVSYRIACSACGSTVTYPFHDRQIGEHLLDPMIPEHWGRRGDDIFCGGCAAGRKDVVIDPQGPLNLLTNRAMREAADAT